jgi:hypothetical protein
MLTGLHREGVGVVFGFKGNRYTIEPRHMAVDTFETNLSRQLVMLAALLVFVALGAGLLYDSAGFTFLMRIMASNTRHFTIHKARTFAHRSDLVGHATGVEFGIFVDPKMVCQFVTGLEREERRVSVHGIRVTLPTNVNLPVTAQLSWMDDSFGRLDGRICPVVGDMILGRSMTTLA